MMTMKATTPLIFMLIACFGAVCQEVIHWYFLRNKLNKKETKILFRSAGYWVITLATIVISGIGAALLFYEGNPFLDDKIPFIVGAAFPSLFQKIVSATIKRHLGSVNLTEKLGFSDVWYKYFS